MACQTLNAPPAGVTAYLVAGSSTTMLAEGLPDGARLEFAAVADGPVLLSLEGVERDAATAFDLTARQVDDLIAREARYVRIVTGDGDTLHVLAAGRVWERSGWSGDCGRTQVVTRLIAGPPGPNGDTGADGRGIESITDDDEDGIATVLFTDGATGALPLPRGPQGDPAPPPEIAWAGDVLTVDGVSSPPLSGPAGPAPATSWSGTSLIVGDNPPVDLQGPAGARGPVGSPGAVATASDFLLVGPGRPDTPATTGGIVTGSEPVGCEFRSTDGAGVGAWVWMKQGAKWVVTSGDTGWRGVTKDGISKPVFIARVNNSLHVVCSNFQNTVSGTLDISLPTGYRLRSAFSNITGTPIVSDTGASIGKVTFWDGSLLQLKFGSTGTRRGFTLVQPGVVDPWPTTLPGSPS